MQPVTPLPWKVDPHDLQTHNRPTRFWETGINNGDVPVADTCGASQREAHRDAEYIVHACNAYPKLIAALRSIAKPALGGKQQQYAAQAILHEVGEVE